MNAGQLLSKLERIEVSADRAPDCRRVIRGERMAVADAIRSGDAGRIQAAATEAIRVAKMWQIKL